MRGNYQKIRIVVFVILVVVFVGASVNLHRNSFLIMIMIIIMMTMIIFLDTNASLRGSQKTAEANAVRHLNQSCTCRVRTPPLNKLARCRCRRRTRAICCCSPYSSRKLPHCASTTALPPGRYRKPPRPASLGRLILLSHPRCCLHP